MSKITIISEPLIEKFGRGFTDADEQPETPCSGDGLNMAAAIHRFLPRLAEYSGRARNHEVSLLCGLGDDEGGRIIRGFMEKEGLNTNHAIEIPGRKTSAYVINLEDGGLRRSVVYENRGPDSAMCQFLEGNVADAAVADIKQHTDILVITGIGASRARSDEAFGKLLDMAKAVRQRGGTVVVDFNHRIDAEGKAKLWADDHNQPLSNEVVRQRMDQLYALSNLAFIAHDEIWPVYSDVYTPSVEKGNEPRDGKPIMEHLMSLPVPDGINGKRDVFFKCGREGGTLFSKDEHGEISEYGIVGNRVAAKERNGGGDNLIGGAIAALLSGYTLEQSLNVGQRMAGQVVQHLGGVIRNDYLPTNAMLDAALGKSVASFQGHQDGLKHALNEAPFVPVFQLTTHNGQNSILQDAKAKVAAMYKCGIRQFEFLLRGDETMLLDQYIDKTLAAIDVLAKEYPDAKFGVGTVSSPERMQKVAENPNVAFIVTAHWPGEAMIKTATWNGKPIIPTVSQTEEITVSADGKIAAPGKTGTDTLNPERIKALREMGVDTIKIFDFGAIAKKRLGQDKPGDSTMIASGLVAIAEAIKASYDGQPVPTDKQFYAMTTGGVTKENLPYLAAGAKNSRMKEEIANLLGGTTAAQPILDILRQTTVVAGGTFITKDYDKAPNTEAASRALEQLSRDVCNIVKQGKVGVIDDRIPGS